MRIAARTVVASTVPMCAPVGPQRRSHTSFVFFFFFFVAMPAAYHLAQMLGEGLAA